MMWIAVILWVVMFVITTVLNVAALATTHWLECTHSPTNSELSRGLFHSTTRHPPSCDGRDAVFNIVERAYEDYRVEITVAFLMIGIVFDVMCLVFGVIHFRDRAKAKQKLWVRSIPTVATALSTAACVLIGCLVFLMDLEENEGPWWKTGLHSNCTLQPKDFQIITTYGFSFILAIISGGLMVAKTLVFSIMACGC